MRDRAGNERTRSFATPPGLVAWGCALALATPSCRSTEESSGSGWSYERSGDWHVIHAAELHRSVGESHYVLKLEGRSTIHGAGEKAPSAARGGSQDWQCFLVAIGPFGRGAPLSDSPRLSFGDRAADAAGAGSLTLEEPRFDFAVPPGILAAGAESGVRWTLRDGERQLGVDLSADYVRGFLSSLSWAGQVRAEEERATPAR